MSKRFFALIISAIGLWFCCGYSSRPLGNDHSKASQNLKDTVDRREDIQVAYQSFDSLFQLEADSIGEADFEKYEKAYHIQIDTNLKRVSGTDSFFFIKTSKATLKYPTEKTLGLGETLRLPAYCAYYQGYQSKLGAYFVYGINYDEFGIGENSIIDAATNVEYLVPSMSDGAYESRPVVSSNQKYLAFFDNDIEANPEQSYVLIVKVLQVGGHFQYSKYALIQNPESEMRELVWSGDSVVAMKLNARWQKNWLWVNGVYTIEPDSNIYVKAVLPEK